MQPTARMSPKGWIFREKSPLVLTKTMPAMARKSPGQKAGLNLVLSQKRPKMAVMMGAAPTMMETLEAVE